MTVVLDRLGGMVGVGGCVFASDNFTGSFFPDGIEDVGDGIGYVQIPGRRGGLILSRPGSPAAAAGC